MDIRKFFGAPKGKNATDAKSGGKETSKKASPNKESDSSKKLKRKAQETGMITPLHKITNLESEVIDDDDDDFVQETKKKKVVEKKTKPSPPKAVSTKKKPSRVIDDDDDFEVVEVKEEKMDVDTKPKRDTKPSAKSKEPSPKKVSPAKTKASPKPKETTPVKTEPSPQKSKPSPKKVSPVKVKGEDEDNEENTPTKSKTDARANFRKWQARAPPPLLGQKERPVGKPNCLQGYDFLLTGVLPSIEREDCHDLIKQYGGTISKSVTKKLTHLVVGDDAGESKLSKVKENPKIKIINEDELYDLIRNQPEKSPPPEKPAKKVKASPKKSAPPTPVVSVNPNTNTTTTTNNKTEDKDNSDSLWQDKYRPMTSKDLVGNPGCVEQLKTWLNNWNKTFGKGGKASKGTEKAALLSGPPGLGKTSTALLVAQECGYSPIEFNASDTRSKLAIKDQISQIIDNRSLSEYFTKPNSSSSVSKPLAKNKTVVIMDEVDGMSAGDRGGMAELIQLIKKTQTPFICICNDRANQKVRSLVNYCKDIRFKRPTILQMVPRLKGIAKNEKLVMEDLAVEKVAEASRGDMRQAIGLLQMLSLDKKGPIKFSDQLKNNLASSSKNVDLGPFDATTRLIATAEPLQDRLQYYFVDSSLVPLFIHENYLTIRPHFLGKIKGVDNQMLCHLETLSTCADSLSDGDLIDKAIYSGTHWELQPIHAVLSSIKPTTVMRGTLGEQLRFPGWLGKNSSANKRARLLKELQNHMSATTTANKTEIRLHYLSILKNLLINPLVQNGTDSIEDVIALMDAYDITKEDFESISELAELTNADLYSKVPTNVKSAFTRTYNAHHHAMKVASGRVATKSTDSDDEISTERDLLDEREPEKPFQEEVEEEVDTDDVSLDKMIKKKERKASKTTEKKAGKTKEKSATKTKSKSSKKKA